MNRILALLLLATLAACPRLPEGERRELLDHWPARGGRDPIVKARGEELALGGKWVKDGEFVFYDERGNEVARGSYRKGVEHGPWQEIEADGDIGRGVFRDGLREGGWTYSYPDGTHQEEGAYVEGRRHGLWTRWHPGGEVAAEVMYRKGQLHGPCTYWDEDGRQDVQRSGRYENGEKID